MSTAIEFQNITKTYENKTIIDHLNLSIQEGEFVTMIGSSGCGKTTTLKMVNGLIARSGRYSGPWREYQDKRSRIKMDGYRGIR